jgi:hypothetical protein
VINDPGKFALWRRIETELTSIIGKLEGKFSQIEMGHTRMWVDNREYELALDDIVAFLMERNAPIPKDLYEQIELVGELIQVNPEHWTRLRGLIRVG